MVSEVQLKNTTWHVNLDFDTPLPFGKYKGTTPRELLATRPTYMCWVVDKFVVDAHPKSEMKVHFKDELLTAVLDAIIDDERCVNYGYLLPDEYTAEKREEKRAAERAEAERAKVYDEMGWGGF
jgi:uncharacterized protein (DUF3820 family)